MAEYKRLMGSHLVVQRGLRGEVLAQLLTIESAGVRCCNSISATMATADRLSVASRLSNAGIAVPATRAAANWADVREAAAAGPVVVKSRDGPWVLQELVPGDGRVRKLYFAGNHLRTLLKPAATTELRHDAPEPIRPPAQLVDLAAGAGATLGLDIYNVDVIVGPDGPCVIDVNPFPGFRGIPGAADLVADHVRSLTGPHV